ncbi:DUF2306 domain-containing protein [Bacillus piscicola]|uniref:DUF2306 domain-containing protein n=1 Tax=Bacillus piscicola TaxID=1632684 RepID=UPI001F0953FC
MVNLFSAFLIIHITAGSICLFTGAIAAGASKRRGIHTIAGEVYHGGYVVVCITSVAMAFLNWSESAYLFYIALFSYGLALLGNVAQKKKWRNHVKLHIGGMLGSYIGIITAVLVVNAAKLPILADLPVLLLWFLPTIIGTPFIVITGNRYVSR